MKVFFVLLIIFGIFKSAQVILNSTEDMKGFDPYEILEV